MDVKSLAKALPLYGQQAVRSALNALSRAGHLHRVRGLATTADGVTRWVFRTFWSSTARDNAWWACFLGDGEAVDIAGAVEQITSPAAASALEPVPTAPGKPRASAYRTLARLGRGEPRLALSDADRNALADLVLLWLERGATSVSVCRPSPPACPIPSTCRAGWSLADCGTSCRPCPCPTPCPPRVLNRHRTPPNPVSSAVSCRSAPSAASPGVPPPSSAVCARAAGRSRRAAVPGTSRRTLRRQPRTAPPPSPAKPPSPPATVDNRPNPGLSRCSARRGRADSCHSCTLRRRMGNGRSPCGSWQDGSATYNRGVRSSWRGVRPSGTRRNSRSSTS